MAVGEVSGEMGGDRQSISSDAIPVQSQDVRRRVLGAERWLVRDDLTFAIDPITDAVWVACADGVSAQDIIGRLAAQLDLPPEQAREMIVGALRLLVAAGLVWFEGDDREEER